jgi:hypothetical protein
MVNLKKCLLKDILSPGGVTRESGQKPEQVVVMSFNQRSKRTEIASAVLLEQEFI